LLRRLVWRKFTDVSEVLASSIIALMMEAANTSETDQARRHSDPEDNSLYPCHCENLKSHKLIFNDFGLSVLYGEHVRKRRLWLLCEV
jgi:hypothetical protein